MTSTGKKWLIGCGVAAGLTALVLVTVVWGGVTVFQKAKEGIEELEASGREMDRRFGDPDRFVPAPDGRIGADRIEAFLAAREALAPARNEVTSALATLEGESGGKLAAGARLIPGIFRFYRDRNEACLEAGIGPGEYGYLYILSFYAFLGKPVTAGPKFALTGDSSGGKGAGPATTEFDVREDRQERILTAARNLGLAVLRNQLAALEAGGGDAPWEASLRGEIELLEADRFRLPWRDGLPDRIAESLEPYRDRLEGSWDGLANPLEIGPQLH